MPRVTLVLKSRKAPGRCGACSDDIPAGDPYRWWKFRYGGKRVRCIKYGCRPRQSDLTQSELKVAIYGAQEATEADMKAASAPGDVVAALEQLSEALEGEIIPLFEEKMENIEQGFGHTELPVYQELEERRDEVQGWSDSVTEAVDELTGIVADADADADAEEDVDEDEDEDEGEDDGARLDDMIDRANEVISQCPE